MDHVLPADTAFLWTIIRRPKGVSMLSESALRCRFGGEMLWQKVTLLHFMPSCSCHDRSQNSCSNQWVDRCEHARALDSDSLRSAQLGSGFKTHMQNSLPAGVRIPSVSILLVLHWLSRVSCHVVHLVCSRLFPTVLTMHWPAPARCHLQL